MNRHYSLLGTICGILLITAAIWFFNPFSGQSVYTEELPSGAILTKEDAIRRATWGLSDAKVLDARLILHAESYQALGGEPSYYEGAPYRRDDPVWVTAFTSEELLKRPSPIGGLLEHAGAIYVTNAVDGLADGMNMNISAEHMTELLKRLAAFPDRSDQLQIVPRETFPKPDPAATEQPTATPLPLENHVKVEPVGESVVPAQGKQASNPYFLPIVSQPPK